MYLILGTYRILTGSKPPGPASKTGAIPLGKNSGGQNVSKGGVSSSGKGSLQAQGKGSGGSSKANAQGSHQVINLFYKIILGLMIYYYDYTIQKKKVFP